MIFCNSCAGTVGWTESWTRYLDLRQPCEICRILLELKGYILIYYIFNLFRSPNPALKFKFTIVMWTVWNNSIGRFHIDRSIPAGFRFRPNLFRKNNFANFSFKWPSLGWFLDPSGSSLWRTIWRLMKTQSLLAIPVEPALPSG
jgi:hypothetical protein